MESSAKGATWPTPELVNSAREAAVSATNRCGIEVSDAAELDAIDDVRNVVRSIWGPEIRAIFSRRLPSPVLVSCSPVGTIK
jgi:hypothetical protein